MTLRSLSMALLAVLAPSTLLAQPPVEPGQLAKSGQAAPILIQGKPYEKLGTRKATEDRMLDLLVAERVKWGDWHVASYFPFVDSWKEKGGLAKPLPPEDELASMGAGAVGPDLTKAYEGKDGTPVQWQRIGPILNEMVELNQYCPGNMGKWCLTYLYGTLTAPRDMTIDATMGSDDGLRFWLNGALIVDADVQRGLDPDDHKVKLRLVKGVNHMLAKVSQGEGGFQFQISSKPQLDPYTTDLLRYHLDVDFPLTPEDEYYRLTSIYMPDDVVIECGGLDILPDGRPIACTRRGDVYIIDGAYKEPCFDAKFTKFASGLHEPLGLAVRREKIGGKEISAVYCVQRGELTRLVDTDGDDIADRYETVSDAWGVSGNYHEFAFGPKFDRNGDAWVTLNVGFCGSLGKALGKWRGWALKIKPGDSSERDAPASAWSAIPICDGLRSPNGIGEWIDGTMFYLDNQGDFVATNRMAPLLAGSYAGHPAGLRWRENYDPSASKPEPTPATIWFPYKKMGQSAADFLLYNPAEVIAQSKSKVGDRKSPPPFGPFQGQVFVGDQTLCTINRVTIEKIDGVYQGACYPFRQGLQCGVNRLAWGQDGSMFVGQTDRGWGSIGRKRFGIERLAWTGKVPFEVKEMRIKPDGFELEFTMDVDEATATNLESYTCSSYTYIYHATYGSPEVQTKKHEITGASLVNPHTVRLTLDEVRSGGVGFVHELAMAGVRSKPDGDATEARPLLHPVAYYTVQRVPKE